MTTQLAISAGRCCHRLFLVAAILAAAAVGHAFLTNSPLLAAEPAAAEPAALQNTDPQHAQKMAAGLELFKSHVRATLTEHCLKCHGGAKTNAEFDLTTRDGLLKGGEKGVAVVPGKSAESLLFKLISHADEPAMPEDAPKLPDEAIAKIAAWKNSGRHTHGRRNTQPPCSLHLGVG